MKCFEQSKIQYDEDLLKLINNVEKFYYKYYTDLQVEKNTDKIVKLLDSMFINKKKYGTFEL